LVAPLTIEEGSVVGAGSVITKKVRKKSLVLTRALQTEIRNYKRKKK
jgi:bifunctional UDP-N-acetylglucosamine pyrophosphorylase/glucosamine-1-phosphate N-acetyltransferase